MNGTLRPKGPMPCNCGHQSVLYENADDVRTQMNYIQAIQLDVLQKAVKFNDQKFTAVNM